MMVEQELEQYLCVAFFVFRFAGETKLAGFLKGQLLASKFSSRFETEFL